MPVAVSMPEAVAGRQAPTEAPAARGTRFLPLSAKSDAALGRLARTYLDWLDGHAGELTDGNAADPLLSDLAWTAGTGRSHFAVRAGIVFRDAGGAAAGPDVTCGAGRSPGNAIGAADAREGCVHLPRGGRSVGFLRRRRCTRASRCSGRCWIAARSGSGRNGERPCSKRCSAGSLRRRWNHPNGPAPALYAAQCGLTALWSSVGIRPHAATGRGAGTLAAAQAAGTPRS